MEKTAPRISSSVVVVQQKVFPTQEENDSTKKVNERERRCPPAKFKRPGFRMNERRDIQQKRIDGPIGETGFVFIVSNELAALSRERSCCETSSKDSGRARPIFRVGDVMIRPSLRAAFVFGRYDSMDRMAQREKASIFLRR